MDATSGFWQIPLSKESQELMTILTERGKMKWTVCPMGISPATDIFSQVMDQVLAGTLKQGGHKELDDILLTARDINDMIPKIRVMLEDCQLYGLYLNPKKVQLGHTVIFGGLQFSKDGCSQTEDRLTALLDFPRPTNLTEVRRFCGLAQQWQIFAPDLSPGLRHLNQIMCKGAHFGWDTEHELEFWNIKVAMASSKALKPFVTGRKTILITDASKLHGCGYILLQLPEGYTDAKETSRRNIVKCGSVSARACWAGYSPLEVEAAGLLWSLQHAKHYLRGCPGFTALTDHQPLCGVFTAAWESLSTRMMAIRRKAVDFKFTVEYCPAVRNKMADALSRAPLWDYDDEKHGIDDVYITKCNYLECHSVHHQNLDPYGLDCSDDPLIIEMVEQAGKEPRYQQVIGAVKEGMSSKEIQYTGQDHPARPYTKVWSAISILTMASGGEILVLDGSRIIPPEGVRSQLLDNVHRGHQGQSKSLELARSRYYWPSKIQTCPGRGVQ